MTLPPRHTLSKSTFMYGCQCPKRLWLHKKKPGLKEEISAAQEMVFEKGTNVGILARDLFPGGADASPIDPYHYPQSVALTQELLLAGEKVIYEAAFQHDKVMAALDILVKKKGKYYAYEVKSSTEVKDYHIQDAALQYYVMTHAGLPLHDIFIVHINNQYVRQGKLDLSELFEIVSVKDVVLNLQEEMPRKIRELKQVLQRQEEPDTDIGPHCMDPFACDFMEYCWRHIPEISIFNISNLRWNKKFELYAEGIIELNQLPEGYSLSAAQQLQIRGTLEGHQQIDTRKIRNWLKQLQYPLYFMDFETFMPAVPLYNNSTAYQHIPCQFSVHIQEKPGGELTHHEFLGSPETDPRPEFARQLIAATKGKGSIMVYSSFEATRLKELIADFPEFKSGINAILKRLVDLLVPFKQKWYYLPQMNGSASIKDVLPALVPEMNYDHLEIGDGGTAMAAFEGLLKIKDEKSKEQIRNALLEYCGLDTLAMVKILEKIKKGDTIF